MSTKLFIDAKNYLQIRKNTSIMWNVQYEYSKCILYYKNNKHQTIFVLLTIENIFQMNKSVEYNGASLIKYQHLFR